MHRLERYTHDVCQGLNLPAETLHAIREELLAHLRDAIDRKIAQGLDEDHAQAAAIEDMGLPTHLRRHYIATYRRQHVLRLATRLTGLMLTVLILLSACAGGAPLDVFCQFLPGVAVIGGSIILLLGTFRLRVIAHAILTPFQLETDPAVTPAVASRVFRTWSHYAMLCGLFTMILGIQGTTGCMFTISIPAIITGGTWAFLSLLYGLLLAGCLRTLCTSGKGASIVSAQAVQTPKYVRMGTIILFFLFYVCFWRITSSAPLPGYKTGTVPPISINGRSLIDPGSFIIVIVGAIGLSIATFGWRPTLAMFRKPRNVPRASLHAFGLYCGIMGIIGTLIGFVVMLANTDIGIHPESGSKILSGIGVAMLSMLYGIVICIICWVFAGPKDFSDNVIEVDKVRFHVDTDEDGVNAIV